MRVLRYWGCASNAAVYSIVSLDLRRLSPAFVYHNNSYLPHAALQAGNEISS